MFKQDCDIFTFFTLFFYIIKGGVYSNDHLNISHPMHRGGGGGGGLTAIDPTSHLRRRLSLYFPARAVCNGHDAYVTSCKYFKIRNKKAPKIA